MRRRDEAKATVLLSGGLGLPEGPRWHDGRLYFTDVWGGQVAAVDMAGNREELGIVPQRPNGLGFMPDGRLLVSSMMDKRLYWVEPGGLVEAADLSPFAGDLANDMVMDPKGRAHVGGHNLAPGNDAYERLANGRGANLILADFSTDWARPAVRVVAEDIIIPNGMTVSPDGRLLIVAEMGANRLTAFDIEDDGTLSGRRLWAQLEIAPDGICMDAEGCVWAATAFAPSRFQRIAEGGQVLEEIALAQTAGFACVLGGEDRRTLIMMEATFPTLPTEKNGRIRTLPVDVAGAGAP